MSVALCPTGVDFALIRLPGGGYEALTADELPGDLELDVMPEAEWSAIEADARSVLANHQTGQYPVVHHDVRVQAHYLRCRGNNCSHRLAEMLALKAWPALRTDSTFNLGRCNGNQFEATPGRGEFYRQVAESAGVNTVGKTYMASLAEYPGDPAAWVSGRGDVERVAREKNLAVTGSVNVRNVEREPLPDVEIAPEIIDTEVDAIMELDPSQRRADVHERVYALRTGAVDPNPLLVED